MTYYSTAHATGIIAAEKPKYVCLARAEQLLVSELHHLYSHSTAAPSDAKAMWRTTYNNSDEENLVRRQLRSRDPSQTRQGNT